ncbi:MAG: DUF3726 domain-containing protein [Mesorhizobium sp.]|nr:MAG: DUF3726 domain-containing protein [Mesorhizobium sp.]RWL91151.1 MAG: DUF3726 domain-containing protein [Mesorhizobium sp.]RWL97582.1 MAG: DUF3726 domain-containing protein [Mesorhizobium sp.]
MAADRAVQRRAADRGRRHDGGRGRVIDLSLNEVETLSAKAARGAGFSWGLAEDVGRASRRIAVEDDNWGQAMLSLAEHAQSFEPPSPARAARWRSGETDAATGGPLCPIRTAALLLDEPLPANVMPLTILDVGLPVWLDAMLRRSEMRIALPAGLATRADVVIEHRAETEQPATSRRGAIDERTLAALNSFAARTYVPESERSRLRGAGGGRVDDE